MPPQAIPSVAPIDFSVQATRVLLRTKSIVHDNAKGNEGLDLFLGELLLDRVVASLVERYSDKGCTAETLTIWLHRTLEDLQASDSGRFTVTLKLLMIQSRVRILIAMGHCAQAAGNVGDGDTAYTISPFVCTPDDLQDLPAVMKAFPPNSSADHEIFQALLFTHFEWEKKRPRTVPARLGARERRRKALFKRRCSACANTPGLKKFIPDLHSWGVDIVSEDESSGEDSGYSIKRIEWRSAEVTIFMRSLDAIYLSGRFTEGKCGRGSMPRERYPSLRQGFTTPKPGLPLNFYNRAWWEVLGEDEKRSLDVRTSLGLQLSKDVQRVVDRFQA